MQLYVNDLHIYAVDCIYMRWTAYICGAPQFEKGCHCSANSGIAGSSLQLQDLHVYAVHCIYMRWTAYICGAPQFEKGCHCSACANSGIPVSSPQLQFSAVAIAELPCWGPASRKRHLSLRKLSRRVVSQVSCRPRTPCFRLHSPVPSFPTLQILRTDSAASWGRPQPSYDGLRVF